MDRRRSLWLSAATNNDEFPKRTVASNRTRSTSGKYTYQSGMELNEENQHRKRIAHPDTASHKPTQTLTHTHTNPHTARMHTQNVIIVS